MLKMFNYSNVGFIIFGELGHKPFVINSGYEFSSLCQCEDGYLT
jgi:hypothetical protein